MTNVLQKLNRIEREKIALFEAGKTHTPDYVWLIEKERALKRRGRSVPRKKKPRRKP
jgi:hypothetical protein